MYDTKNTYDESHMTAIAFDEKILLLEPRCFESIRFWKILYFI
ncbi:hypothetical protein P689_119143 [Candidatus Riesia pediculischaeffi PTSU]|uniref:Uncharacterized protein n=1 Tax=Candidatus Riesia pediculischaeffi PTSU TaxID=1401651 RepID=A0A0C1S0T4_9ENTR|nr:hypothetical protein P689_119143 [Candidatus Riesia pediculischaeffi PTSU]